MDHQKATRTVRSPDGTTIGWNVQGAGPDLILVHGTTADHTRWGPVIGPLAERFTVHAVDRRGRGSSGDAPNYDIRREFEDIAAVVDALEGPSFLLGHSYGGICALEAALLTDGLARLVLYEPPIPQGDHQAPQEHLAAVDALVQAGDNEGALIRFMGDVVGLPPEGLDAMRAAPSWEARIAIAPTLRRESDVARTYVPDLDTFGAVSVPTLLLVGTESPPFLRGVTERLAEVIPNATLREMKGQHHNAMDTAPDLFVYEVTDFLLG